MKLNWIISKYLFYTKLFYCQILNFIIASAPALSTKADKP